MILPASGEGSGRVEVFFDGDCPLCRREINMLRRLDKRSRIVFTDIAAADFDSTPLGKTHAELMSEIHGRAPSGELIVGVEVFRQLYQAVGFGWIVWVTRWPIVRNGLDLAYRIFASNRLRLTGRCSDQACSVPGSGTGRSSR
jgi:predicted DCC family thiol-disulfide oxidoreductase YuxK